MASVSLQQTLEFSVSKLTITTQVGEVDITGIFEELNIFDGILQPCMSGNILVNDTIGLIDKMSFDGGEFLNVEIGKTDVYLKIKKKFHIYKVSNRKLNNSMVESYLLHFVSDEFTYSEQTKVKQSFEDTYAFAVATILEDYLNIPEDSGMFEPSEGVRKFTIPQLSPFEAINWCTKRSLDNNGLPSFVFFENRTGYNFVTLKTLFQQQSLFDVNFSVKNLSSDIKDELFGIRAYEVINQHDFIKNTRSGVYSGTFVGYDPITRSYVNKKIDFSQIYGASKANKNSKTSSYINRDGVNAANMYDSRIVSFPFALNRMSSEYIKQNDPQSIQTDESPEKWYFQRQAIFQNVFGQRLKVAMPGNFALSSGFTLNMMIPKAGVKTNNQSDMDKTLYGKYLIVATRHIIRYNKHETVMELVTDSTNRDIVPTMNGESKTSNWLPSGGY